MSKPEVIDWSAGYDAGYEDGFSSACMTAEVRGDQEDEAWCEGFIKAWNTLAQLKRAPSRLFAEICVTCGYHDTKGCTKEDHAPKGCDDWFPFDD
jgi:hypothetical protein